MKLLFFAMTLASTAPCFADDKLTDPPKPKTTSLWSTGTTSLRDSAKTSTTLVGNTNATPNELLKNTLIIPLGGTRSFQNEWELFSVWKTNHEILSAEDGFDSGILALTRFNMGAFGHWRLEQGDYELSDEALEDARTMRRLPRPTLNPKLRFNDRLFVSPDDGFATTLDKRGKWSFGVKERGDGLAIGFKYRP